MARAGWKYHSFKSEEITNYINYITEEDFYNEAVNWNSRYKTITKLNCFDYVTIYTGKFEAEFRLSKYFIGCKLGQLSKTRKPYFFRSKKKKNVKKKNKLFDKYEIVTAS